MAEAQVPYSWEGQQVEASILGPVYGQSTLSLTGWDLTGTLEMVTDLGIVAFLSDPDDEEGTSPVRTFYPWSSVLWLRLAEGS